MPEDAKEATGAAVRGWRSKSGSISFEPTMLGDEPQPEEARTGRAGASPPWPGPSQGLGRCGQAGGSGLTDNKIGFVG